MLSRTAENASTLWPKYGDTTTCGMLVSKHLSMKIAKSLNKSTSKFYVRPCACTTWNTVWQYVLKDAMDISVRIGEFLPILNIMWAIVFKQQLF